MEQKNWQKLLNEYDVVLVSVASPIRCFLNMYERLKRQKFQIPAGM